MTAEQYFLIAAIAFGASMINSKIDENRLLAFLVLIGVFFYGITRGALELG